MGQQTVFISLDERITRNSVYAFEGRKMMFQPCMSLASIHLSFYISRHSTNTLSSHRGHGTLSLQNKPFPSFPNPCCFPGSLLPPFVSSPPPTPPAPIRNLLQPLHLLELPLCPLLHPLPINFSIAALFQLARPNRVHSTREFVHVTHLLSHPLHHLMLIQCRSCYFHNIRCRPVFGGLGVDTNDDCVGDVGVGEEGFLDGEGEDCSPGTKNSLVYSGRVTKRETIKYSPPIFIISFSLPVICQFPSSS